MFLENLKVSSHDLGEWDEKSKDYFSNFMANTLNLVGVPLRKNKIMQFKSV